MKKKTTIVLVKLCILFFCFNCLKISVFVAGFFSSKFDLHLVLSSLCATKCKQAGDVDRFIRQLVNRGNGPSVTQVKDILA